MLSKHLLDFGISLMALGVGVPGMLSRAVDLGLCCSVSIVLAFNSGWSIPGMISWAYFCVRLQYLPALVQENELKQLY